MSTALITGASSGIGLALARKCLKRYSRVLLLSFDQPELEQACAALGPAAHPVLCDLSQAPEVAGLLARLEAEHGPLDLLVNNAGIGHHGEIIDLSDQLLRRVMEVNFFAPVSLCRQALTLMAARRKGHIVNLTSASARRPLARMGAYGSSKAALHGFTQVLRLEAAQHGVHVSEVLPISVATPFFQRATNTSSQSYRARGLVQTPEQVADCVLSCIDRGIAERVTHIPTGWALALDGLFPNAVAWLLRIIESNSTRNR